MKCPACDNSLTSMQLGSLTVEACSGGCGGAWLDANEITKLDEPAEIDGEKLLNLPRKAGVSVKPPPRACPKCESQILGSQSFDPNEEVLVDVCWSCGGVWLDAGELGAIRSQFKTQSERQQAGDQFLESAMKRNDQLLRMANVSESVKFNDEHSGRIEAAFTALKNLIFGN